VFLTFRNVINRSRDVSSCQRVDARTLRLSDGTVYKLVGMPDHFTSKLQLKCLGGLFYYFIFTADNDSFIHTSLREM
jgi:hypothetical protein